MISIFRRAKKAIHDHRLRRQVPSVSVGTDFAWPAGAAGAVSLTYDDGIANHFQHVAPALSAAGLRGTFYAHVMSEDFRNNTDSWRAVTARGHELGNHTVFHPCRANPGITRDFDLRGYTEKRWCAEIELANWILGQVDNQTERTFGNTCWDNWLGPDENRICLEQLAARYFPAARGERNDLPVNPRSFNRYNLGTRSADGEKFSTLQDAIESAVSRGEWLIFTMHGVGQGTNSLFIADAEHRALIDWLAANRQRIWTAPVVEVSKYLLNSI